MKQLNIIRRLIKIKIILILSWRGFFLIRKILNKSDVIKKKDAIKGAENNKKIPILKLKNPNLLRFKFSKFLIICIKLI